MRDKTVSDLRHKVQLVTLVTSDNERIERLTRSVAANDELLALLEAVEGRAPVLVNGDHLTVNNRFGREVYALRARSRRSGV